jgi:hypothetical protein
LLQKRILEGFIMEYMNRHILRELAKVGVGLFIADICSVLWFSGAGFFPLTILGVTWSSAALWPIIVFDLAIIALLAHYGWSMKLPISSPKERTFLKLIGLLFLIVAVLHLARLVFGWNLILGDAVVPIWVSWLGFIIPGYLSYTSFHFALKK